VRRAGVALLVAAVAAATTAASVSARGADSGKLAVFAAASLTDALPKLNPHAEYSFAGSDQLAAQIQLGARADVFAAASTKYPDLLYQKGLCQKPVPFVTNTLVLIVPKSNPAGIHSVNDLTKPGVKLVIGDSTVPVGSYTLTVLKNLGMTAPVLKNVVSKETDVKGVLSKVALGEADAGFVYVTDARTVRDKVQAIAIRESAQPHVVYEACVLTKAAHPQAAYRFLTDLIRPAGQKLLVSYGFGPRPKAT
jgi:molybdate transport system substrate-binding protein